ncbi:MAG: OprO/OprP family phosphate-selective porin [Dysgonamonadaceae bacterium]|nr:OprO/OprP family phosphate-selective porin [Dysgonamonadaceae bacterium]
MKLFHKFVFIFLGIYFPFVLTAQTNDSTKTASLFKSLTFDGVIKTKMETSTEAGVVRFNVRNSRIGVRGDGKYISYRVQVELSNEGTFAPLDLYGTLKLAKNFSFLFGQQHVPFENDYVITPATMMFANRAFVGKYFTPGSRDIGAAAQYRFLLGQFPVEIQGGIFNGGKINTPQWTEKPSYAFRLIAGSMDGFRASAKMYKYTSPASNLLLCGADVHYAYRHLRVEAEAMNRKSHTTGMDLFGAYVQGAYSFDLNNCKIFHLLTPAIRWDAMGYDVLKNGMEVNRLTVGLNFGLSFIPYTSVLRFDYEQYFGRKDFPDFDNRDAHVADNKITVELVVKF